MPGAAARQRELKLGIDEVGIELGRSCERLFMARRRCSLQSLRVDDLLVSLPSGRDPSELSRPEAVQDDVGNEGERSLRQLRPGAQPGALISEQIKTAPKPHEVDTCA